MSVLDYTALINRMTKKYDINIRDDLRQEIKLKLLIRFDRKELTEGEVVTAIKWAISDFFEYKNTLMPTRGHKDNKIYKRNVSVVEYEERGVIPNFVKELYLDEFVSMLSRSLSSLQQRILFVLYVLGHTEQEAVEIFGFNKNTVRMCLYQSQQLMKIYKQYFIDDVRGE